MNREDWFNLIAAVTIVAVVIAVFYVGGKWSPPPNPSSSVTTSKSTCVCPCEIPKP
jgi:hypothetical protein